MKLRIKIPLFVGLSILVLVVLLQVVLHRMILSGYQRIETDIALTNLDRISNALNSEKVRLIRTAGDYSQWDDTYEFVTTRSKEYIEENFIYEGIFNLGINGFIVCDTKGKLVHGVFVDKNDETLRDLNQAEKEFLQYHKTEWAFTSSKGSASGVVLLKGEVCIFGASPILKTDRTGPIKGALITIIVLDSAKTSQLNALTQLNFTLNPARELKSKKESPSSEKNVLFTSETSATGTMNLKDITGKTVAGIELSMPRTIHTKAKSQIRWFVAVLMIMGILFALLVSFLLESLVIRRLSRLAQDVRIIRKRKSGTSRVTLKGQDELSELALSINGMLESIEKAGAQITESEKRFRLAFEHAKDAILWLEPDSLKVINANQEAERLFELPKTNILKQTIVERFPPEKAREYKEALARYAEQGEPFDTEMEIAAPKSIKITRISGTSTLLVGQRVLQVLIRDITPERKAEQERQQLEEQLRQAQKMEVVGQLAGGIAHDFNNMLSGVSGYSDLIMQKYGSQDATLNKYARVIHETAKSAADLTAKLLAFARKGKHEMALIDLNEVVQDVIKLMEHAIDRRVDMVVTNQVPIATTVGDRTQIQNAILNLAMNAVDAMPEGGELRFSSERADIDEAYAKAHPYKIMPGQYILLIVTDTGTGMDERVKARLFEPFYTTKGPGKGTGLGLASVYGTVKSHNGAVSVYSELGKGSSFKLYFPLHTVVDPKAIVKSEPIIKGTGRVLVIDDEAVVRNVASDILVELGYEAVVTCDGLEGVQYYREHSQEISLVILDIIMPKLGGFDTFQILKAINPDIKVIVSSGYAMNAEAARILKSGAIAFMQKPFDVTKLSRAIAHVLNPS